MTTCEKCFFFRDGVVIQIPGPPQPEGEPPVFVPTLMGWCYRFPPQVTGPGSSAQSVVKGAGGCGEFHRAWWRNFKGWFR